MVTDGLLRLYGTLPGAGTVWFAREFTGRPEACVFYSCKDNGKDNGKFQTSLFARPLPAKLQQFLHHVSSVIPTFSIAIAIVIIKERRKNECRLMY